MKTSKGGLIILSGGCMALVWRYAWANFVTVAAFQRPFPLFEAMAAFGLAAVLTFVSLGKGWRIIQVLGLQLTGFLLAFLRIVYVFHEWSHPFIGTDWLLECVHRTRGPLEWLSLVLILIWALLFWLGGVSLAKKPKTYLTVCARFDLGVAFLFALFLIKFLIRIKGGPDIEEPLSGLLLLPFFLFGLLAIGLARNQGHAQRGFLSGYRGLGVVLSFSAVVLLFGAGLVLLFYPYLTVAAEAGYGVLKVAARPVGSVLIGTLLFVFAPRRMLQLALRKMRLDPPASSSGGDISVSDAAGDLGWWAGPIVEAIRFLLLSIAVLAILALVGLLLRFLFKWLLSRTPVRRGRYDRRSLFSRLVKIWEAISGFFRAVIGRMGKRRKGAVQLYAALLGWGHRSGVPRFLSETPMEYGRRLMQLFPDLGREVASIVEVFNQEVYGGRTAEDQRLAPAQRAWERLRSPLHWLYRFKTWFLQA